MQQTLPKPQDTFFYVSIKRKTSLSIKQKIYVYIKSMVFYIYSFFHDEYSHKNDLNVGEGGKGSVKLIKVL